MAQGVYMNRKAVGGAAAVRTDFDANRAWSA
jgi:hypothetical protein